MTYILKHPSKDVTGFLGGVDFWNGTGSTSNLNDVFIVSKACGCKIYDEKGNEVKVVEKEQYEIGPDKVKRVSALKLLVIEPVIAEETKTEERAADAASPLSNQPPNPVPVKAEERKFKRGRPKK